MNNKENVLSKIFVISTRTIIENLEMLFLNRLSYVSPDEFSFCEIKSDPNNGKLLVSVEKIKEIIEQTRDKVIGYCLDSRIIEIFRVTGLKLEDLKNLFHCELYYFFDIYMEAYEPKGPENDFRKDNFPKLREIAENIKSSKFIKNFKDGFPKNFFPQT